MNISRLLSSIGRRFTTKSGSEDRLLLPADEQVTAWRKANRRMKWGISKKEFTQIPDSPGLSTDEARQGYWGWALFYGFGQPGGSGSDTCLSGKRAWEMALKTRRGAIWQCQYADFQRPQDLRLRPGAPPRPRGFYWARFHPGEQFQRTTVAKFRQGLQGETGCGPEGFQLLCVTHPHLAEMMNQGEICFWALADYDLAPHGFNDFCEAPPALLQPGHLGYGGG